MTTCCQKLDTPAIESPFCSVPIKSTPTAVPVTPPTPPRKLVPPSSTAAAASSGIDCPDDRAGRAQTPAWITPAERSRESRDPVDEDERAGDVDPREPRRLDVAADGVHVPPEVRPAKDDERDEVRREHDPDRRRDPEDGAEPEPVDERAT